MTRCENCDNIISDESEDIYCEECYNTKVEKIEDLELTIGLLESTIKGLEDTIKRQRQEWEDMKSEIYDLYKKF